MLKGETKEPISFAEAKDLINKVIKEKQAAEQEPTYEQESTLKYITTQEKLNKKDSEKLTKELVALGLPPNVAVNVVNIMPKEIEILEVILSKRAEYNDAKLKEIFKLVESYQK
jgi:DNA-directed RNA polymerase subunit F